MLQKPIEQSEGAVLCLVYCYVTQPDKVTAKAQSVHCMIAKLHREADKQGTPQATNKAERLC